MERPSTPPDERRPIGWPASPTLPRAEFMWVVLAGIALAVLTSWPLVLHLPSRIAPDLGDPVRTAWQIAWVGHGMLHDPLHLFNANAFYPHPLSLAFSDSLLGYGPAGFIGSGTVAALVRYNLLFLLAWSLCFLGAYLLARELGLGRAGGAVAGAAFAYAPYRVTEAGHLHVISSGGIPLALFLLLRGYRRSSVKLVLAGWLVSAWQVSLGFTLGLQYCYLLAVLGVLALWHSLRARTRARASETFEPSSEATTPFEPEGTSSDRRTSDANSESARAPGKGAPLSSRMLAITCAGVAVLGIVAVYEARPYLQVSHDYPTARRKIKEVERYSAGPRALLAASSENRVWAGATATFRNGVSSKNESVFFPGATILVLALIGLVAPLVTPRLRLGLLAGALTCAILSLGLGLTGAGYPYRLLYDFAPGWDGVRVPGRLFTTATLFLALLAGAGGDWLSRRAGAWGARHSLRGLPALAGCVLVLGVVAEGAGHLGHPVVPRPARAEIGVAGPLLDLPTDGAADRVYQYFSTDGFPKILQGNSTFDIPSLDDLRGGMNGFPDRPSVEKLRYYGVRTVVLHLALPTLPGLHRETAEPPDPRAAAAKPIAGLGISRRSIDSIVIYEIGPGPKALHGSR